jgi:hypothetical protein
LLSAQFQDAIDAHLISIDAVLVINDAERGVLGHLVVVCHYQENHCLTIPLAPSLPSAEAFHL